MTADVEQAQAGTLIGVRILDLVVGPFFAGTSNVHLMLPVSHGQWLTVAQKTMTGPSQVPGHDILYIIQMKQEKLVRAMSHTHSAENTSHLQHKVEFGATWYFACSLSSLQRLRFELGEQKRQTGVIIMRLPNICDSDVKRSRNIWERCL